MTYDPTRTPEIIDFENQKHLCLKAWDNLLQAKREHIIENNQFDTFIKMLLLNISEETVNKISLHIQQYGNRTGSYTKHDIVYLTAQIEVRLARALSITTDEKVILHTSKAFNDLSKIRKITEVL